ncbi:peptidyl-prolyl cis-trans isomerase G-like [Lytechinus pictus]|uniref:peptidyl-prolyl cis-trans isomerase G-like n=1 Tax=Lytechinus pictus TaxID=7653 RepID=UPI00240D5A21|nr:peptidyl-prolyl cis-trans isomerase G-like [Lytechinus pictus]
MPKAKSKKSKTKRRHESSSSSSYDDSSDSYSSSASESEDDYRVRKKQKSDTSKKQQKKDKKKAEKEKKKKTKNKISKEDYYSKSKEFRVWLMEEKNKPLDELSSKKSKAYFKKFVKKWNSGKLLKKYYKGIDFADEKASLTKYKWKFSGVGHQPLSRDLDGSISMSPFKTPQPTRFSTFGKSALNDAAGSKSVPPDAKFIGPSRPPPISQVERENNQEAERKRLQKERKDFKSYNKMVMDELAPKATGHEAKMERKYIRAHERRERQSSPGLGVENKSIMGGPSYDDVMERRRRKAEDKKDNMMHKANMKLTEYQLKEQAKMKALFDMAKANKNENSLWK